MSASEDISIPLEPDCYYHIFNQGNNHEKIFYQEKNYIYFLKKLAVYMSGYFDFYAYCLLPNHFHLLVKIKTKQEISIQAKIDFPKGFKKNADFADIKYLSSLPADLPEKIISEKFRRFFLSYSKSINKQENRSGSLFRKYFRRKRINSDDYFTGLIWYIHNNPVKHNVYDNFETYKWSSYYRILQNRKSLLNKKQVFNWFDSKENFVAFHKIKNINWKRLNNLIIEAD